MGDKNKYDDLKKKTAAAIAGAVFMAGAAAFSPGAEAGQKVIGQGVIDLNQQLAPAKGMNIGKVPPAAAAALLQSGKDIVTQAKSGVVAPHDPRNPLIGRNFNNKGPLPKLTPGGS